MTVTEIIKIDKGKSKVFLDEEFAFALYRGEIRRFHIEEGAEISDEDYEKIIVDVVLKRAKARSLHLLESMDRTENQIRMKLRQNFYTEEIIDSAVEYVKSYGYINDERYARNYAFNRSGSRSRRQIKQELQNKGISKDIIGRIFEGNEDSEAELIEKLIKKKRVDPETATKEEKQKLYGFLMRKGFSSDEILRRIRMNNRDY